MTKNTKWSIDQSHVEVAFKVRHLMISHVKGSFRTFDGSIYTNEKDFTSVDINFWIDAASITTGDDKRDEHLKGAEFFDVVNHKQIGFTSSSIGKADSDNKRELWGDLTIKGITKKIKLIVQFGGIVNDPYGNEKAGFSIKGKINRSDWGLVWNTTIEKGGFMVGDEVDIFCNIELQSEGYKNQTIELEPKAAEVMQ